MGEKRHQPNRESGKSKSEGCQQGGSNARRRKICNRVVGVGGLPPTDLRRRILECGIWRWGNQPYRALRKLKGAVGLQQARRVFSEYCICRCGEEKEMKGNTRGRAFDLFLRTQLYDAFGFLIAQAQFQTQRATMLIQDSADE